MQQNEARLFVELFGQFERYTSQTEDKDISPANFRAWCEVDEDISEFSVADDPAQDLNPHEIFV